MPACAANCSGPNHAVSILALETPNPRQLDSQAGILERVDSSVPQRLEAVKHRRFTARLKPCPSYRDAFSFSFLAVAPKQQFVQNVPSQLKAPHAVPFVSTAFIPSALESWSTP